MAFTEPLAHDVMSSPKRSFLTIGSDAAHLRIKVRERCTATTHQTRSEAFTEPNEVFVTTTTESVSV